MSFWNYCEKKNHQFKKKSICKQRTCQYLSTFKKCFHSHSISNSNRILLINIKTNILNKMLQVYFFHLYEQQRKINSQWTTKNTHFWMNKKINNKKCSFKKFMFVKCLANTLDFTKHDSYLYDCSWTSCSLIYVNKKNSHHCENYVFIWTNNFIKLRFLMNDCRMCDCSNILQSSIIWAHFNVIWEFIFESIFFFSKSLTMMKINSSSFQKQIICDN